MSKTTQKKRKKQNHTKPVKTAIPRKTDLVKITKELDINKTKEFHIYLAWRSLSPLLMGRPQAEMNALGIVGEAETMILGITSKREFARTFNLDPSTLKDWDDKITNTRLDIDNTEWMTTLTKNVNIMFYQKTLQEGDAHRVRLWHELFGLMREQKPGDKGEQGGGVDNEFAQNIIKLNKDFQTKLKQIYDKDIIENEGKGIDEVSSAE